MTKKKMCMKRVAACILAAMVAVSAPVSALADAPAMTQVQTEESAGKATEAETAPEQTETKAAEAPQEQTEKKELKETEAVQKQTEKKEPKETEAVQKQTGSGEKADKKTPAKQAGTKKAKASVPETEQKQAEAAQAVSELPGASLARAVPNPGGNLLSTYRRGGVQVEWKDFGGPVIPSEYTLNAEFGKNTTCKSFGCGNTKDGSTATALSGIIGEDENLDFPADTGESRYLQDREVKILKEGTGAGFGMWYYNVGVYTDGNRKATTVDMKMTITDYKLMDGHTPKLGAVAFDVGKNPGGDGGIGIMLSCVDWVRVKLEYFVHGTSTPISVKGYNTLGDIDGLQGVCFLSQPKNIYVDTSNDFLKWVNYEGNDYIYGATDDSSGQIDDTPLKGQLAWTFEGTSQEFLYATCVAGATHSAETDDLASMKRRHLSYRLFNGRAYFFYEAAGVPIPVTDPPKGSVTVIKKDEKTGEILKDAGFTLYKKENGTYDRQGELKLDERRNVYQKKELTPGDYRVTETKFPADYVVEREPWSRDFTVPEDVAAERDFTFEATNRKIDPKLSISKLANKTTGVKLVDGRYDGEKQPGWYTFGEEVTYRMIVRNYGNVTAKNLKVVDTMAEELKKAVNEAEAKFVIPEGGKTEKGKDVTLTADSSTELTIDRLEPEDSVSFDFKVTLKEKDVPVLEKLNNVVKVTGDYENGDETGEIPEDEDDTDEDKINLADPKLSISKLANKTTGVKLVDGRYDGEKEPGWYTFGEEVTYRMIVRNYGNVTAKNLKVKDSMTEDLKKAVNEAEAKFVIPEDVKTEKGKDVKLTAGSSTELTIDRLEPGDSVSFDFKVTLKEKDVPVLEKLKNVVKVTGEYETPGEDDKPIPEDEDDTDEDKINVADPKLSVSKLADKTTGATLKDGRYQGTKSPGTYEAGGKVTYKIIARNYGNVAATDVTVTDVMSQELKNLVTDTAFTTKGSVKTEKGKTANVRLEGKTKAVIDSLEPGDSVTLLFTAELKKENLPSEKTLDNVAKVTGNYQVPGGEEKKIPEDEDDTDNDQIRTPKAVSPQQADGTTSMRGATSSPKTGDGTQILIFILLLVSAAVNICTLLKQRKPSGKKAE